MVCLLPFDSMSKSNPYPCWKAVNFCIDDDYDASARMILPSIQVGNDANNINTMPVSTQTSSVPSPAECNLATNAKKKLAISEDRAAAKKTQKLLTGGKTAPERHVYDEAWERKYELLLSFRCSNGHCHVLHNYIIESVKLGWWVSNQRIYYKNYMEKQDKNAFITAERITKLLRSSTILALSGLAKIQQTTKLGTISLICYTPFNSNMGTAVFHNNIKLSLSNWATGRIPKKVLQELYQRKATRWKHTAKLRNHTRVYRQTQFHWICMELQKYNRQNRLEWEIWAVLCISTQTQAL